ncbi:hypothetical protein ACSTIS_23525, partial [Vibrio parahaemolyticus]
LTDASTWPSGLTKEKLVQQLSHDFDEELPGIEFNFSQYIQDNVQEAASGVKGENSVKIFGNDLVEMNNYAEKIKDALS